MSFVNRIIQFGVKAADQFAANPDNPRLHPQFQRDVMHDALTTLGWLAPVVENARTGYLIDGHERVMQALLNNEPVPYVQVDLSPDEEQLALATFDPIGELALYDPGVMHRLIDSIETHAPALQSLLDRLDTPAADTPPPVESEPAAAEIIYIVCPHCGGQVPL